MILVKNYKLPLRWFWGKIGLEVVFDDYLVKKQVVLDYKNIDFKQWPFWDLFKGVNPWFWSIKNWILQSCHTEIFYIGVNPRLWSKIANFLFVCLFVCFFWQNKSRNNVWGSSNLKKSSPQQITGVTNLTSNKSFSLATNHSACINFCPQSVSKSISQQASQLVKQSVSQSSASWPVNHSASQSVCQSGSQSVSQSASQ